MASGGKWYGPTVSLEAASNLSSYQYYVVKFASTAGQVKLATTPATDTIIGVLQNEPTAGQEAQIAGIGYCIAAAEASVSAGNPVTCSSTGRVKATTTDKDEVLGFAMQASSAAGDLIQVHLTRFTLSA